MSILPLKRGKILDSIDRARVIPSVAVVDPVVPDYDLKSFDPTTDTAPEFPYSYKCLQTANECSDAGFFASGGEDGTRGLLRVSSI